MEDPRTWQTIPTEQYGVWDDPGVPFWGRDLGSIHICVESFIQRTKRLKLRRLLPIAPLTSPKSRKVQASNLQWPVPRNRREFHPEHFHYTNKKSPVAQAEDHVFLTVLAPVSRNRRVWTVKHWYYSVPGRIRTCAKYYLEGSCSNPLSYWDMRDHLRGDLRGDLRGQSSIISRACKAVLTTSQSIGA